MVVKKPLLKFQSDVENRYIPNKTNRNKAQISQTWLPEQADATGRKS